MPTPQQARPFRHLPDQDLFALRKQAVGSPLADELATEAEARAVTGDVADSSPLVASLSAEEQAKAYVADKAWANLSEAERLRITGIVNAKSEAARAVLVGQQVTSNIQAAQASFAAVDEALATALAAVQSIIDNTSPDTDPETRNRQVAKYDRLADAKDAMNAAGAMMDRSLAQAARARRRMGDAVEEVTGEDAGATLGTSPA